MSDLTGTIINERYHFDVCLGEGTFAKVYRVHDKRRNVDLAAKVLRTSIADDTTVLQRFRRESELLNRLQHPNIVRFYDFIETDDLFFILMDYVPGETLQKYLYNMARPLKIHEVFTYLKPLTAALHFAHGEGIVHRDLKPGNILLHENGTLLVTDFGIAHVLGDMTLAQTEGAFGTPLYMAPEQILSVPVSSATDVYALGIILYRMLTGGLPFKGEHPNATGPTRAERVAYEHLKVQPVLMRSIESSIPLAVEEVVMRCLAKEPRKRPTGVREVYDELAEAIGAAPSELTPLPVEIEDASPVLSTLPEVSQFIQHSTQEGVGPEPAADSDEETLETGAYHPQTPLAEEEETAENFYPRHVLEGRERPVVNQSRPMLVPQLPPDQVSISKPTPPGIVIPPQPAASYQQNPTGTGMRLAQRSQSGMSYTLLMGIGIFLVLMSCVALGAYAIGLFDDNAEQIAQPSPVDSIPTVTPGQADATDVNDEAEPVADDTVTAIATDESDDYEPFNEGLIVYSSSRYGANDIFVTDPTAGSVRIQLTDDNSLYQTGPSWSPDGSRIAYYAYEQLIGDDADIWVMNADGTGLINITDSPAEDDRYVSWSPDGTQLIFHSNRPGPNNEDRDYELFIYDFATDAFSQITDNDIYDLGADWSPDGERVAFHSYDFSNDQYRITVLELDSGEERYMTPPDLTARFPTWSPDGSQLAFYVRDTSNNFSQIYVMNSDGSRLRPLLDVPVNDIFPDWSPDGSQIVFHRQTSPGVFGLFRYFFDEGIAEPIGNQLGDFFPDWVVAE